MTPKTWGTGSTVVPIRSAMTQLEKSPKTARKSDAAPVTVESMKLATLAGFPNSLGGEVELSSNGSSSRYRR